MVKIYFQAVKSNGVYELSILDEQQQINIVQAQREDGNSMQLWHHCFIHRDPKTIIELQNRKLAIVIMMQPTKPGA